MTSSVLDLAPNHKSGLVVANPILLGGGVIGCGEGIPDALRSAGCGAMVVGPFTLSSRRGRTENRLADGVAGFVLETGLQNRGARNSIKRFDRTWQRLGVPLIAQIAATESDDARRIAAQFQNVEAVAGLELLVADALDAGRLRSLVEGIVHGCEKPLWVKLPYSSSQTLAAAAVEAGADALVISHPPVGMLPSSKISGLAEPNALGSHASPGQGLVSGPLYGPSVLPLVLRALADIEAQQLGVPLIASASFHRWEDVDGAFQTGAAAIQLDGTVWIEPGLAKALVRSWKQHASQPNSQTG